MLGEKIRAKAREFMHGKTCEFCHTTFGEHSEEQFDLCWNRLREERKRLQAEGKIPTAMEVREGKRYLHAGITDEMWDDHPARESFVRYLVLEDCAKCSGYVERNSKILVFRVWAEIAIVYRLSLRRSASAYPRQAQFRFHDTADTRLHG